MRKTKERELQGACETLVKISQSVFALLTFDQSSFNFTDPLEVGQFLSVQRAFEKKQLLLGHIVAEEQYFQVAAEKLFMK